MAWKSDNEEKKVVFEIYIDKETTKNKFEEEIKQRLEWKNKNNCSTWFRFKRLSRDTNGRYHFANGLQRDYKRTGKTNEFEKHFKKKTNFKIAISKTWKKIKK